MTPKPEVRRSSVAALLYGAPIGLVGGLIGLGGAEFRLPVLAGVFGYAARCAVALNLAISLVTVVSALLIRGGTLSFTPLLGLLPVVVAMIVGAVSAAYVGTALVHRVSEQLLERIILMFLVVIGAALIVEAFLPQDVPALLPDSPLVHPVTAMMFGLAIGLVSSLLGVAGGEPIARLRLRGWHQDGGNGEPPDLAADHSGGMLSHRRLGSFVDHADLTYTVAPIGVGSVAGALIGGPFVSLVTATVLKLVLGMILIVAAVRIFYR